MRQPTARVSASVTIYQPPTKTNLRHGRGSSAPSSTTARQFRSSSRVDPTRQDFLDATQDISLDSDFFSTVESPLATHHHNSSSESGSDEDEISELLRNLSIASARESPSRSLSSSPLTPLTAQAPTPRTSSPNEDYLNTPFDQWDQRPPLRPDGWPSFLPIFAQLTQQIQLYQNIAMATTYRMPSRGAAGAPSFDPSADPRSILGFFDDLEFCFEQAGVTDATLQKNHAVRYAPDSEKTIWRAFDEFSDATKTFADFMKAVKKEYVGEDSVGLFSRCDLDLHVESMVRAGMRAVSDFNVYSRRFHNIAGFLVTGNQLQKTDRDHLFL